MSDLKAPGGEGGFQSLRRTLNRPIWLQWINWYKHSPAPPIVWWYVGGAQEVPGAQMGHSDWLHRGKQE